MAGPGHDWWPVVIGTRGLKLETTGVEEKAKRKDKAVSLYKDLEY
jgi:hypothetical protein